MNYNYKTNGVCSREISFDLNNGIVTNINFVGGCPGNLKMISKILDGWKIEDIIEGERCSKTAMQEVLKQILEEAENLA